MESPETNPDTTHRKFGKQIQKKQLEIPEYAASFVDYKALKKLIKELKNSPVPQPGVHSQSIAPLDPQSALQANKASFFFRLDRELDKVNAFYTVKESESKVRLRVLLDKQRSMRLRNPVISKISTQYITLEQGFQDFIRDLSKLQQFIEINATAFSKILKKWDKTSKSQTKALYLSRAVDVQPCFNHDVISDLSDQASTALLNCAAWAEGESTLYGGDLAEERSVPTPKLEQDETDNDILDALYRGDVPTLRGLVSHLENTQSAAERLTKAYLTAVSQAPEPALKLILETGVVDLSRQDEINDRNCLHKTAMTGRLFLLQVGLQGNVDPLQVDAYSRIPLHYACMNGHVDLIAPLVNARPESVETPDLDGFTPLIHAIVKGQLGCVEKILSYSAKVDASSPADHIPLNLACQYGSVPIVELLLQRNPKIMPDAEGLYPQHLIARFGGDPHLFLLLRDHGADLDQPDKLYQWTPLFHAASEGRVECLQKLLDCGVNATALDEKGFSAQYYAIWEGYMECMALLAPLITAASSARPERSSPMIARLGSRNPPAISDDVEIIPDLTLPPPIIPTRRYGHNFLELTTTVVITLEDSARSAVTFYDESKYPAARLTISPRSSDLLPRNLLLPIQDENRSVSFEVDNLSSFAVDFDVYPTFGKKVIAKGSVPPEVFLEKQSSSGYHYLSLLDPRLRSVGQIFFRYQVIKPFQGKPLEITSFPTYWKATSQFDTRPNTFVTGSSLSGQFLRLYVQMSRDGIPVLYPRWTVTAADLEIPVIGFLAADFLNLGAKILGIDHFANLSRGLHGGDLSTAYKGLEHGFVELRSVLNQLPPHVNVELHVLFPSPAEEEQLRLGPSMNINDFVDKLLLTIFTHVRELRHQSGNPARSIVFSCYNKDVCISLNWKQPNFPVLLCNDLGTPEGAAAKLPSGRSTLSLKDAVRIAQANNLMGLICQSQIFDMVPALINSIKVAGLVLVSDASSDSNAKRGNPAAPPFDRVAEGIDGIRREEGILRFRKTVEM